MSIDFGNIDYTIVPKLFEQFVRIREASPEVEKIINLFLIKSQESEGQATEQAKLDDMTFRFILSDPDSKVPLQVYRPRKGWGRFSRLSEPPRTPTCKGKGR